MSCVPNIVQLIIERGAKVSTRNANGESAIFYALRFSLHSKNDPAMRLHDVANLIETLKILIDNGLDINDQRNDQSTAVQNYLTRADSVDIQVLEFIFSSGFNPNLVVSKRPIETVSDRIWDLRLSEPIRNFIREKLLSLGYKPKK